jgi:hypothetical protein
MIDNTTRTTLEIIAEGEGSQFPARLPRRRNGHSDVVMGIVTHAEAEQLRTDGLIEYLPERALRLTAEGRAALQEPR